MVEQLVINVDWKQTLFKGGWIVKTQAVQQEFMLSRKKLSSVPRDLRNPKLASRFEELISGTLLLEWWNQTCGGTGTSDKLLLLRFPSGIWDIPWELLIKHLALTNREATVCLVRTAGKNTPLAPSLFGEPLRVLILKGAYDGLDLDREVELVQKAWQDLELNVRQCIEKPITEASSEQRLPTLLQKHKPHIIWFSGHGRTKPDVYLKFADGNWVNAAELAQIIKSSGEKPLYAVFWACETARGVADPTRACCAPPLFEELSKIGFLSILAMQSPIRDASALDMAQNLFRYLAIGLPLERAAARVRAHSIENPPENAHSFDWASPVTWSAGIPVDKLQWNAKAQMPAQYQVLGRHALSWGQVRPQQLDTPTDDSEKESASRWSKLPRLWVRGSVSEAEHRYYWLRILKAIQLQTELFVVTVEIDKQDQDPAESLQKWAKSVYDRMLPGDFPDEFAQILDEISRVPSAYWPKLCELEGVYLAIANPPEYRGDWFWEPLNSYSAHGHVAILSDQEVTPGIQSNWSLEKIGNPMKEKEIAKAVRKASRLARALAVLNIPLRKSCLSIEASEGEGASSLADWPEWEIAMIDTSAGPIMTASSRQYILNKISPKLKQKAHLDCVKILSHPDLTMTTAIRHQRLKHLLGASMNDEAILEACRLCYLYRDENRPFSVSQVLDDLSNLAPSLPTDVCLIVAWAYLELGKVRYSDFWLRRSQPRDPLDVAWKHCLQAELYKSSGTVHSKENALAEIKEAVRVCQEAERESGGDLAIQRQMLAYRQDRARIMHFLFYNLEEAEAEYEELVRAWNDIPDSDIDLAIVKRNYAECLRSLAKEPGNPKWQRAVDLLNDAKNLSQDYPHIPVLSETLYEMAKVAEKEGHPDEALNRLEECIKAALQSHHFMMLAIAQSRAFWLKPAFDLEEWRRIESTLSGFPNHGWAVRVLLDGRLRAAKILEDRHDCKSCFAQLEANLADINRNLSFDKGSDRLRIAATMAGLQLIGDKLEKPASYWQQFLSKYDWAQDWLREYPQNTAENIWRR